MVLHKPKAQFVAARKVSKAGSIGGLNALAGREVILLAVENVAPQARKLFKAEARRAHHGVRVLRERLEKGLTPTTAFLAGVAPAAARAPIRRADAWIRASARQLEKRLGRAVNQ